MGKRALELFHYAESISSPLDGSPYTQEYTHQIGNFLVDFIYINQVNNACWHAPITHEKTDWPDQSDGKEPKQLPIILFSRFFCIMCLRNDYYNRPTEKKKKKVHINANIG